MGEVGWIVWSKSIQGVLRVLTVMVCSIVFGVLLGLWKVVCKFDERSADAMEQNCTEQRMRIRIEVLRMLMRTYIHSLIAPETTEQIG